jgi:5-methylcytosine-specific restriction endonuclease McrA
MANHTTTGIREAKLARSPHQPTGTWITPKRRLALYLRDSFCCVYCLRDLHSADPRDVTLDHLKARADGGGNESQNCVTACRSCNSSRRDQPLVRFASPAARAHIRRNVRRAMPRYLRLAQALIDGTTGSSTP